MILKFRDSKALFTTQLFNKNTYGNGHQRPVSTASTETISDAKPFVSMPGLSSLPFIGPLHHFLPLIGELPDGQIFNKFDVYHAKYGPIMKMDGIFGRRPMVFVFEPEEFEKVYKAEETNPIRPGFKTLTHYRGEMRKSTFQGVHGLSTAQGPKWRDFRTKVNPTLLNHKIIKLYAPGLEEIADDTVARISKLKDEKHYLQNNFELELTKWSLESVALIGLGDRLGCLRDDLTDDHPARQLLQCTKEMIDLLVKLEFVPSLWKYISTPSYKRIVEVFDTQWNISSFYINEAKKKINARGHDIPEEDKSVIEKLLAIDEKVAIMMANEMLLVGIDTVAFTAMSILYHLAVNQNAQDELRQEILSNISTRYLRACMKESMRILHVTPVIFRRATKDYVISGYHVPKGTDVIAPKEYLSNIEKYYPRPNEFLPQRWLVDRDDPLYHGSTHPMVTMSFGYGARGCIGRRIAEFEIEIFLKKLLKQFKVTWEGPPVQVKMKLLNTMETPFRINFEPIDEI